MNFMEYRMQLLRIMTLTYFEAQKFANQRLPEKAEIALMALTLTIVKLLNRVLMIFDNPNVIAQKSMFY